jgi:predicted neuraminidase
MFYNRLAFRRRLAQLATLRHRTGNTLRAHPALQTQGSLFTQAPFRECHAATIAATQQGLVAAWFAGTAEGRPDVDIWCARHNNGQWSAPRQVTRTDLPAWNPVLFQPRDAALQLYYKTGADTHSWRGWLMESPDQGQSWGQARQLPTGIYGPIKNKPIQLADGRIISPSSEERDGWRVHTEHSDDNGHHWQRSAAADDSGGIRAIQPSVLSHPGERLQLVCRSKKDGVVSTWSDDQGRHWSPLQRLALPNPNSGTDALTLADGRHLLVYNPSARWRFPLSLALSDDGLVWRDAGCLERGLGEYSYPAVIQDPAGLIHIVYTWNLRHIKHVVLDPKRLIAA